MQWVSPGKLFQLSQARPDYFVLNEAAAHQTRVNNAKRLQETISALYFRADARLLTAPLKRTLLLAALLVLLLLLILIALQRAGRGLGERDAGPGEGHCRN